MIKNYQYHQFCVTFTIKNCTCNSGPSVPYLAFWANVMIVYGYRDIHQNPTFLNPICFHSHILFKIISPPCNVYQRQCNVWNRLDKLLSNESQRFSSIQESPDTGRTIRKSVTKTCSRLHCLSTIFHHISGCHDHHLWRNTARWPGTQYPQAYC